MRAGTYKHFENLLTDGETWEDMPIDGALVIVSKSASVTVEFKASGDSSFGTLETLTSNGEIKESTHILPTRRGTLRATGGSVFVKLFDRSSVE